ncbi:MAG TPA: ParB/RepB/Spo0J family partition protein [Pseudogracilibacillus sp.]|nr:ParB/RepB/Spo0J family partition protein [Pseudogracilibacillus sp.]
MGKRLGKGLNALISDISADEEAVENISIDECRTNPYQPRKSFDADAIEELKISIIEYGIIQPLILRRSIKGYEIVAGERRWRAAKDAGLDTVPAIVKDFNDNEMMEIALLENLQREDLSIIEEAYAYKNLISELGITQEDLANKLGKSRSHITNTMRLLSLPDEVIAHISSGALSMGHGKALLGIKEKSMLEKAVQKMVDEHLNVRQAEQLVISLNDPKPKVKQVIKKDPFVLEQESNLREILGTNVKINKNKNKEKGSIAIDFYDKNDFDRLLQLLSSK